MDNKNTIKLSDLITWVKQEIRAAERTEDDPAPLFAIDEVTLEVNFMLEGETAGKFNMVVVKADGIVSEQRVQKATIHMKAIVSPERLAEDLEKNHPKTYKRVLFESASVLLKGRETSDDPALEVPDY